MSRLHKTLFGAFAVIAIVAGIVLERVFEQRSLEQDPALLAAGIILLQQGRPMPALQMLDEQGQAVQLDQLKGKWSLLFFGYTFCPDVCPTTLAQLRNIRGKLPSEAAQRLQVYLVSVDPARDTPAQLKQYLGYFDKSFKGLTGPVQVLQQFSEAVSIPYVPADTSKPNYTVQHSGNLAVVAPDGRLRGFIRAPFDSAKLQGALPGLLGRG
ncbi:SCO family protein [Pseudomonas typographi]|uniref:SCO family protein n=1 Tax=Pseudomonas typographi TaxID=2715964 RepID=A0ABR7Z470_9PSED|nr:SCO family protein [Pseudomonas typographi]MBD1552964.1 SCO family protein [Pseudomonas typographi]MBD1588339.1 SCO family protein [Pseudomonas typographi]MBD1600310.1 SCO family protein [Pseudomonas typographi]